MMTSILAGVILAASASAALSIAIKASVVAAIALMAVRLAARSRASVRHLFLTSAFAALLVLPVALMLVPALTVPISVSQASTPATPIARQIEASSVETGRREDIPHWGLLAHTSAWVSTPALLVAGWITGAAVCLFPLAQGLWRLRRLRRGGRPWVNDWRSQAVLASIAGVRRHVEIRLHEGITGPMTYGVIRPVIVLPSDAASWSEGDLRRALVHELEHVRRADWLISLLARGVCAVYWFQPLVWSMRRQLALAAEMVCDDAVVGVADRTAYAEQLMTLAQRISASTGRPALAMASRSDLAARVSAVLNANQLRGRAGMFCSVATATVAIFFLLVVSPLRAVVEAQTPTITAPRVDWQNSATAHFDIAYPAGLQSRVEEIGQAAEAGYQRVSASLRHNLALRPMLVLYATRGELERAINTGAVPGAREHILLSLDSPAERLPGVLVHEITHTFSMDIVPTAVRSDVPSWVHEGLAEFERGVWDEADQAMLRELVRTNGLPRIAVLGSGLFQGDPRAGANLGHAAFDLIASRNGIDGIRRVLASLRASGDDTATVISRAADVAPSDFDRLFEDYLKTRFP